MRGIETGKVRIRHEVFTEIARMAYEGGDYAKRLEELPFKIIPGEIGSYRDSLFLERAVVGERLRLAMGLPLRKFSEFSLLSDGVEKALDPEIYYEKPLINVIKFACNRCPDNVVKITNVCQGCLEHPCMSVCPRQAITRQNGQAHIDPDKCIRCGRCLKECKFNAIVRLERPCRKACGMDCIHSDGLGRADIDYSKCTSCGQCMVSCPFGAISDKSQIFQTIQAVKSDTPVYVALAPAFVGQFGPEGVPERMRKAFQRLGFADVYEVAIGADLCVIEEAADFLEEVPDKHKFMVTSCCPSWSDMVKKLFPQFEKNISVAFTPMVLTARMIKRDHPDCKVVFIGPCDSKKLEARRQSVRSDVDFVLTFEEALGIFAAKGMDKAFLPEDEEEMPQPRRAPLCLLRRRGAGGRQRHPRHGTRAGGQGRRGDRSGRLPQAADDGQGRKVRRLPARGHGLPGRLHRRCGHAAPDRAVAQGGRGVQLRGEVHLRQRHAVHGLPAPHRGEGQDPQTVIPCAPPAAVRSFYHMSKNRRSRTRFFSVLRAGQARPFAVQ